MLLRLTKRFTFEMAHALPHYQGKCHNIHGHSYKLYVTVEGTTEFQGCNAIISAQAGDPSQGMVIDFSQIKQIVEQQIISPFDHALVLPQEGSGDTGSATTLGGYPANLITVDFQPTTENLLLHFARLLDGKLPKGTRLRSLKLYETESSCAELIL